eukprot:jgi/Mesen1/831/ME000111S10973
MVASILPRKRLGVYVYDSEGRKYLDALAGLWSTALGGSEERLVRAADEQMRKLPYYHSFWNRTTEPALALAKELKEMFTAQEIGQVFFTSSGSEANDTQVKLVWYYNNARGLLEKKKFIARQRAYHGSTLISASLTGLPAMHKSFDIPVDFVRHTDCPDYAHNALPGESEEAFSERMAANLEALIQKEGAHTVGAFIGEPLMGAGGVLPPPAGYWEKIQAVLKRHDVLLIADEVVCAFGRLGAWFGSDYYGIKPDLVSIAKALSSAYAPIGAILISRRVAEEGGMRHKCGSSPIVGEIRGVGLIMAVEFVADKKALKKFPSEWGVGPFFASRTAVHGMLVRTIGDIIAMSPPLVISPDEIEELIAKFELALRETEEYVEKRQAESGSASN